MSEQNQAPTPAAAIIGKPLAAQPKPAPASSLEITLDQFGIELSRRDKRVELLNAFIFVERQAKHFKDTKSNYQGRFEAFIHQPV